MAEVMVCVEGCIKYVGGRESAKAILKEAMKWFKQFKKRGASHVTNADLDRYIYGRLSEKFKECFRECIVPPSMVVEAFKKYVEVIK